MTFSLEGAALALGCYFSIHFQVARQTKFRSWVPLERLLLESDHGVKDPPAGIPARIQWVEHLVAQQYGIAVSELRQVTWQNFARLIRQTETGFLLPSSLQQLLLH